MEVAYSVTFDNVPVTGTFGSTYVYHGVISEDGLVFDNPFRSGFDEFFEIIPTSQYYYDGPGVIALWGDEPMKIRAANGTPFSVQSIDVDSINPQGPAVVTFKGITFAGGSISQTFEADFGPGLQTVALAGFDDLSEFTITYVSNGTNIQVDNLLFTRANSDPAGEVTISGTAAQGQTLTAHNTLSDADGLGPVAYQWWADGSRIPGATSETLLIGRDQVGQSITVVASYTDGGGTVESVASAATQVSPLALPTDGDDILYGTPEADVIDGYGGNDQIYGNGGNDTIRGGPGSNILDGGDGGDLIWAYGADTVTGGSGNDYIDIWDGYGTSSSQADGGSGDDLLYANLLSAGSVSVLTGGDGHDTFALAPHSLGQVIVTDFTAGAGGDILRVDILLGESSGYSGGNPFERTQGYLRLVQQGADTVLLWDPNGTQGGENWRETIRLQNTLATDLTAVNFSPAIADPAGSNTFRGTPGNDTLQGTEGNDTIFGLEGNDTLDGYGGNDQIYGNGGNDTIRGGEGADTLDGGDGNDVFVFGSMSEAAYDTVLGGSGTDRLRALGTEGSNGFFVTALSSIEELEYASAAGTWVTFAASTFGESGVSPALSIIGDGHADTLGVEAGETPIVFSAAGFSFTNWINSTFYITGHSTGGDNITGSNYADTIYGQGGDDTLRGGNGADTLNGGEGNDVFVFGSVSEAAYDRVNGDGGIDRLKVLGTDGSNGFFVTALSSIEELEYASAAGTWVTFAASSFGESGVSPALSIIGDGHADTLGVEAGETPIVFSAAGFSFTNWINSTFYITGHSTGGDNITGSNYADTIYGQGGDDTLRGGNGADTLNGGEGNDVLQGGAGVDILNGGAGIDTADYSTASGDPQTGRGVRVNLANGRSELSDAQGDQLISVENLTGSSFNDTLTGNATANTLQGGAGNDTLSGGGGAGIDLIYGGDGNDVLTGGVAGATDGWVDIFVFNTRPNALTNYDVISTFEADGLDKIALDPALFAAIARSGSVGLDASEFRAGNGNALDANDFILYERATGKLFYDADGSGAGAKVLFAQLTGMVGTLDSTDFTTILP